MNYTGSMSAAQGMVAFIDIPLSLIVERLPAFGSANSYQSTLTIDDLFATSQKVQRLSLDPMEQKWIPPDDGGIMTSAVSSANVREVDGDFMIGVSKGASPGGATTTYSLSRYSAANNPRVIGFAWKNFASTDVFPLQFDLYKNIEWVPDTVSGITVPRSVRVAAVPPLQDALVKLDLGGKSWTQEVMHEVESAASHVAKTALAFSGRVISRAVGLS
jgi:hypothetical protein